MLTNTETLFTINYSLLTQNRRFCCIRAEPRKPAKPESDGMQGVKERPKEAPLTTMQTTLDGCGLEGGDRRL